VKRGEDATPAADAYSLGVVFFRLLTGMWYENGPNAWTLLDPFEPAWREILRRLLAEDPRERPIPLAPMAQMLNGASHKTQSGRRISIRVIGLILVAAALVFAAVFMVLHFRSDADTVRTDDLYSIPSCIPEE
jgi:serine/threonine protein kinase